MTLFPLLLILGATATIRAAEPESPLQGAQPSVLSGRLFSDVYIPSRNLGDPLLSLNESAWLQLEPKLGENASARALLTIDRTEPSATSAAAQTALDLCEAYATYEKAGVRARFGRQLLPWGKSDGINPTDYLSAKNYSLLNPDDEVKRLGGTALELQWTPQGGESRWSFTAVWQLAFPQSTFLVSPSSLPSGVIYQAATQPAVNLPNSEQALKIAYQGDGWDASLSAFRGYNHLPEYFYAGLSGLTPVVGQRFNTVRAAGADASLAWGALLFRLETSYVLTENDSGANPLILPSHWDAVLGVERPIGDRFRVQVQGIARMHPRYTAPSQATGNDAASAAVNPLIARANALLEGYQDPFRPALTARFGYTNEDLGIDASVSGIGNLVGGDYFLKPSFTYAWTEAFKTTLGWEFHAGPEDRPFGALKSFDSVYFEAKVMF